MVGGGPATPALGVGAQLPASAQGLSSRPVDKAQEAGGHQACVWPRRPSALLTLIDLSVFPDDWGLQAESKAPFMPRALVISSLSLGSQMLGHYHFVRIDLH